MPAESEPALNGVRVLVVDDERDSRELVAAALTMRGAEVVSFGSAIEALEEIERQPFDVLVSDIGMPEMDGYWLIKKVRQLPQSAEENSSCGFDSLCRNRGSQTCARGWLPITHSEASRAHRIDLRRSQTCRAKRQADREVRQGTSSRTNQLRGDDHEREPKEKCGGEFARIHTGS
jgi:CheY-like chemotaxis protein